MDVRGELTATFEWSDWATLNYSNRSCRNCHRNDANYVGKARLDLKTSASLPSRAPVSSKTNESCWLSDEAQAQEKFSWQRKQFSGVKNLRSAPLNTYCSFSRWFNQNWQALPLRPVTVWLASRSQLYLFTIWHVKCSTRHKSSSFGVFRFHSFSVMSYQEQNYLTSICLRHCLTRRRREKGDRRASEYEGGGKSFSRINIFLLPLNWRWLAISQSAPL